MRTVRIERPRGTAAVSIVIDPACLPAPCSDGLVRVDLDPHQLLILSNDVQSALSGLVLMAIYPPAYRPDSEGPKPERP